MSEDVALKACPFCGGEATIEQASSFYVVCADVTCGAEGPWNDVGVSRAIAAWNRRHQEESK